MSNEIVFQEDYEGHDIIISLFNGVVKLYDDYNSHHDEFKIEDVNKYIDLCKELQDYQEYDEESDEYYDPDEVYTNDHDDGFLLLGDWATPWRFEYYIDAIESSGVGRLYKVEELLNLNDKDLKDRLKDLNVSTLQYILKDIKKQKELQQA